MSSGGSDLDPPSLTGELPTITVAARQAAREAASFDRRQVSLRGGLIAAIPAAAMLSLGTALNRPAVAVSLGVGAVLVGMSWRAGDAPAEPPVGTMAADAVVLGLATVVGTVAGQVPAVHLVLLAGMCAAAGLATVLGRRGVVIGTQAIVAYVILGAFPEPLPQALALGGLVLLGGAVQVAFCALVASPLAYHRQRAVLAVAYDALAAQAREPLMPAVSAAGALEQAELTLALPALFADPELMTLTALVGEGRRIRLELTAFAAAQSYLRRTAAERYAALEPVLREAQARIAETLELISAALAGDRADAARLVDAALALGAWGAQREPLGSALADRHLAALTGQVNGAARQVLFARGVTTDGAGQWTLPEPPRRRGVLPSPSAGSLRRIAAVPLGDLRKLRDAARLDAPAGRHALRLTVVVTFTELLSQVASLPHGTWAVLAAATVLRPGFGATFRRGAERVFGTCAGVVLATLIAVAINPQMWGVVAVVALLSYLTFVLFPASFTAGVAGLTAVVVFLIHAVSPDTTQLALDRGIDTLIGGGIGLLAYALWPTWSGYSLPRLLGRLIAAQGAYLALVLGALISGRRPAPEEVRAAARGARLAWGDAEAMLKVARTEPVRGATGPTTAARMLAALRRLVYGVHALRLAVAKRDPLLPHPQLVMLAGALNDSMTTLGARIVERPGAEMLPPLRSLYRRVEWGEETDLPDSIRIPVDELIDAVDSLALALGLELPTES